MSPIGNILFLIIHYSTEFGKKLPECRTSEDDRAPDNLIGKTLPIYCSGEVIAAEAVMLHYNGAVICQKPPAQLSRLESLGSERWSA
ncbi:hypothetical protein AOZ07_00500 [Glutamicibacter halophytocola]|nr:hypothetical protein AOZ07_00500 [Glutamicibacter halophytocola]